MRAVGDALTGVLYRDDAQVVTIVGQKVYGTNPRAEIYVERVL
jgi:Holliday junction resolvase RusA-like endonuclease